MSEPRQARVPAGSRGRGASCHSQGTHRPSSPGAGGTGDCKGSQRGDCALFIMFLQSPVVICSRRQRHTRICHFVRIAPVWNRNWHTEYTRAHIAELAPGLEQPQVRNSGPRVKTPRAQIRGSRMPALPCWHCREQRGGLEFQARREGWNSRHEGFLSGHYEPKSAGVESSTLTCSRERQQRLGSTCGAEGATLGHLLQAPAGIQSWRVWSCLLAPEEHQELCLIGITKN